MKKENRFVRAVKVAIKVLSSIEFRDPHGLGGNNGKI